MKVHYCIQILKTRTLEHQIELKNEGEELGYEPCTLMFPDNSFSDLSMPNEASHQKGVMQVDSEEMLLQHISDKKSKGLFLQSPYDEHHPPWMMDTQLDGMFLYAGYGLNLSNWRYGHFELPIFSRCNSIFADNPISYSEFNVRYGKSAFPTGNPLMWRIRREISERENATSNRILWAPHWSASWLESQRGFSRWEDSVAEMKAWAERNQSTTIVFRPHPILKIAFDSLISSDPLLNREAKSLMSSVRNKKSVERILEFLRLPNVEVSIQTMREDVLRCDKMFTDGVSIIGYWMATGKPIAVWRDAESPPFNLEGETLIRHADIVNSKSSLRKWLESDTFISDSSIAICKIVFPTAFESPVEIWGRSKTGVSLD